jgi:phospholipase C
MAVDHVVVLCLENRSFDHMLGFLDHPDPTFEGLLRAGPYGNPDEHRRVVAPTPDAKRVLPFGPDHSHDAVIGQLAMSGPPWNRRPTNQAFVASYEL